MFFLLEKTDTFAMPTWKDLVSNFGPFYGTLVFTILVIVWLQWYWYRANLKSKNEEIDRSVKRVTELEKLNHELIKDLRGK